MYYEGDGTSRQGPAAETAIDPDETGSSILHPWTESLPDIELQPPESHPATGKEPKMTPPTRKVHKIALIGFRATGKSFIGKLLAERLLLKFVDMDEALTASFGEDISSWVRRHGWESFRKAEGELLRSLAQEESIVVACGGGVVLAETNRATLQESFFVVWLEASEQTIYNRLTEDPKTPSQRPALTSYPLREEIERSLAERLPLYEETAHLRISTDEVSHQDAIEAIVKSLR